MFVFNNNKHKMCIHEALKLVIRKDNLYVFTEIMQKYKDQNYNKCKCSDRDENLEIFSLFESISYNAITILKHLLKFDLVNKENKDKRTPLYLAATYNHKESVELLLKYGADPNKENDNKQTPLHLASYHDCKETVELLLKHGVDPNKEDNNKQTPLHLAVNNNSKKSVELLLKCGVDPNKEDNNKKTPLHYAAMYNRKKIVELLLKYKADPNKEDNDKRTPLHLAAKCNYEESLELLLKCQADLNKEDNNKWTPLYLAAIYNHKESVELLLKYGADPNKENDNNKRTPLHLAAINGCKKTFNALYQITDAKYRNDPIISKFAEKINFKPDKINEQLFILQSYELDSTSLFAELCRDMVFVILKHIKNEKLLIRSEELMEN